MTKKMTVKFRALPMTQNAIEVHAQSVNFYQI